MKLYRVKIQAIGSLSDWYVVAVDPANAYHKVNKYLTDRDWCFRCDREMDSVTLLAEEIDYPDCKVHLLS